MRPAPTSAALWAVILAAGATGCADPEVVSVSVDISIDPVTCGGYPEDYLQISCGGSIGVWLLDARTDEVIEGTCVPFEGEPFLAVSETKRILSQHGVKFAGLPGDRELYVEMRVYSPPVVDGCPRDLLDEPPAPDPGDPDGMTDPGFAFMPNYFGTSAPARLSGRPALDVSLECWDPFPCDAPPPPVGRIEAVVSHTETLDPVDDAIASELDVRFGFLDLDPGGTTAPRFSVVGVLQHMGMGLFALDTMGFFFPPGECMPTLVTRVGAGATVSTLSCEGYLGPEESLFLSAYFLDKNRIDSALAALGLARFPDGGLLLGRVVDGFHQPVAGAQVAYSAKNGAQATPRVLYPSSDWSTASNTGGTASHGYFLVDQITGEKCCGAYEATDGARTAFSLAPTGLVPGTATFVLLRTDDP